MTFCRETWTCDMNQWWANEKLTLCGETEFCKAVGESGAWGPLLPLTPAPDLNVTEKLFQLLRIII